MHRRIRPTHGWPQERNAQGNQNNETNKIEKHSTRKSCHVSLHRLRFPRPEFMRIAINLIPKEIMDEYNLHDFVHNGYVYFEINKGM